MYVTNEWDWEPGKKTVADLQEWRKEHAYMEEPYVSPDGEKIAAIIKTEDAEFGVCENGEVWESTFDKAWYLRYAPDNRLTALVSELGEWTVAVDGETWENKYEFVWDARFGQKSGNIMVMAKADGEYLAVINDTPWENTYLSMTDITGPPDCGHAAGVVQTVKFDQADIYTFQDGCYSVAVDGEVWDKNFVNVWEPVFSPDGRRVAAQIRTTLYDYTIAVDGEPWGTLYPMVWEPKFSPVDGSVTAPVKIPGGWTLAKDGKALWDVKFAQLWQHQYSPNGDKIAAIVAPVYGKWTVAVDGKPSDKVFGDMATDLVFSPIGGRTAFLGKEGEKWSVVVDGTVWAGKYDMAWKPVFSPDGHHAAAKVEKGGRYTIAVNGKELRPFKAVWDPIFSPDSDKVLIRAIEGEGDDEKYIRQVLPLSEI